VPTGETWHPSLRTGLLLTHEDLSPGFLLDRGLDPVTTLWLDTTTSLSPLIPAGHVGAFAAGATADVTSRWAARLGDWAGSVRDPAAVANWAIEAGLDQIVTPYAPVGPAAARIRDIQALLPDIPVICVLRTYDAAAWPHATKGFFRFRGSIPTLIEEMANSPDT